MIALLGALGLVTGALLPRAVALIPDRAPADSDDEPAPTPYRVLAAARGLPVLLAVATAAVWMLSGLARPGAEALPAYLAVGALGVAMSYVDLREHLLPDWLTLPSVALAGALLAVAAAITGDWSAYGRAWAAAGACFAFYLILVLIRPADLGLGDVKLAAAVGLLLGWVGWSTVMLGVFCGFLVGGLTGLALMLSGRAGRRSSIPFGPPMLAGAWIALLWTQLAAAGL